jgi:multidrug efflux system membrane fusion protein
MRRVRWVLLVALLVGIAGFWIYLRHDKSTSAQSAGAAQSDGSRGGRAGRQGEGGPYAPTPVVAGVVEKKDVPIYRVGIGTVQAYNTVNVHPQVSGTLVRVAFQEGQDVKKGDLLAEIDPRTFQAQLEQATSKKDQDIAQLNNGKALLDRDTDLFKKGVLDHQTYDTQRFLVDQLNATVKGDQAAIDNAQTLLDYTRVTAPFDGRCGIRQVDQGNYLTPGSSLVIITQLKPISVIFTLPQQDVFQVNQAFAHGTLKVSALNGTDSSVLEDGTLSVVDNQIDPTTGTVRLKASFDNPELKLWPGQFVNARLLVSTVKDGLVVPASVVQRGPKGTYAYVITPEKTAEMRSVHVGQITGGEAQILDGLEAGEQVVVDGQYKLQPGGKVDIVSPRSTAARALAQVDVSNGGAATDAGSSVGEGQRQPRTGQRGSGSHNRNSAGSEHNSGQKTDQQESTLPSASPSPKSEPINRRTDAPTNHAPGPRGGS